VEFPRNGSCIKVANKALVPLRSGPSIVYNRNFV